MTRAVAVNVGANTNQPGVRGPVWPDGRFAFLPIPETEPTARPVPTYADVLAGLENEVALPPALADVPVHLDPEFAGYPCGERYTYGDPWGVKARPILDLSAGDYLFFYATLDERAGDGWGAYLVGQFRLAADPLTGEAYRALSARDRRPYANNAHVKRETFDAAVLCRGDERSGLYERAVRLSGERGVEANALVTEHSADSGRGPWWRRPLRYDETGVEAVCAAVCARNPPVH